MGPAGGSLPGACVGVGGSEMPDWKQECDLKTGIQSKNREAGEVLMKFIREQIFHPVFHIIPLQKTLQN